MLSLLTLIPAQTRPDVALVPQVGAILRAYGRTAGNSEWEKPARLQALWLARPPRAADRSGGFDFADVAYAKGTGITVDWILRSDVDSDGRARHAYDDLLKTLGDEATAAAIGSQARRLLGSSDSARLGDTPPSPLVNLRAFHLQSVAQRAVSIDMTHIPIDPEEAALGHFAFYAVPVGRAERWPDGTIRVSVERFLVYALDSFDFSKPVEALGFFKTPDTVSPHPGDGVLLTNLSYRDYRGTSGRGGDFLVMTDTNRVAKRLNLTFGSKASAGP